MKAHGVNPAVAKGGISTSASNTPKRTNAKKRKVAPSDDLYEDDDEEVKPSIKEDGGSDKKQIKEETKPKGARAKKEKLDNEDDGSSKILNAIPEAPHVGEHGGDDHICLLCTTEQTSGYVPACDDGGALRAANPFVNTHPFEYLTDINLHPQALALTASNYPAPIFTNSTPPPPQSAWLAPHPEPHHYYWNMLRHETPDGGYHT